MLKIANSIKSGVAADVEALLDLFKILFDLGWP